MVAIPNIQAITELYAAGNSPYLCPQCRLLKGDDELIKYIYEKGTGGVNDVLLKRYAGGFDKAVTQVFGAGRQYPDLERELRLNAGKFGTYKTYDLCRELERAREAGLSLEEFKDFATGGIGLYNGYQRTEYNTLVSRSRTAKQWERFQDEKLHYPNIEWLRTASANPRAEHLAYIGLILPMDDPFWTNNQPGNLYNCKCDWRSTDKAATKRPDTHYEPAAGLEGNPAETNELVTERHPYFKRNGKAPRWVDDKAKLQCPDEVCFVEKTTPSGNKYLEHLLVSKAQEATDNRMFAALLVENGHKDVKLLPKIKDTERSLRERYFGKDYAAKHLTTSPDAWADGALFEFKKSNIKQFTKRVGIAAGQSNIAFIRVTEPISDKVLKFKINKQWDMSDRKNLEKIIVYSNGELKTFTRK